jgi:hypothetical protein
MKIKSAKSFRYWYKNLIPARRQAANLWDENYIGAQHKDISGFLTMYHGDKEDIYGFLRKEVEMAEDGQAIYEFVQNAADCDSTQFYMFYDENYLVVINNGSIFSKEGIKSILNIGQSFGKTEPDKIGRYGIGFKLVHRLVGKSSGLDELFNNDGKGYRGPILFSWSQKSQFQNFLNSNELEYVDIDDNDAPWLLKILITNFPAQPSENVKDIYYKEIQPFKLEELNNFKTFLSSCSDKIDFNTLDSGTVFYLKLGDKKYDYLEKQKYEYLNGLSTSMHFLKSLDRLIINDSLIQKDKDAKNVLEFTVESGSDEFNEIGLTEIRDKESDAKFKVCFADNANSANNIKKHPNIYKYFPAVKEVNDLSFIIHSNLFELSSNRQNLTETPVNKNLLSLLSKKIIAKMEVSKSEERSIFKNLFISILMSEDASNKSSGNGWQSDYFYNILLSYVRTVIPTKCNNYSNNPQKVKISNIKLELNLSDFGLGDIQWFEWDDKADKLLLDEATRTDKLGIEEWEIRDIVENADLTAINNWIANCDIKTYEEFMNELERGNLRRETKEKICQIKLFKFTNGNYYSINDMINKVPISQSSHYRTNYSYHHKNTNAFFTTPKLEGIREELAEIGIILSEVNVARYPNIFSSTVGKPDEKDTYNFIADKCKTNKLSPEGKKKVFLNFIGEYTRFDNVSDELLKDLHLFSNKDLQIKPLRSLISNIKVPSWLGAHKINEKEYFPQLAPYLISETDKIFTDIFLPNKGAIIIEITSVNEIKTLINLFRENRNHFFTEYIIHKDNGIFSIKDKTHETYQYIASNRGTPQFVRDNLDDVLTVLPYELYEDCKDELGILKGEELYDHILQNVEVNALCEQLVKIIHYEEPKRNFILRLTELRLCPTREYTIDCYEYKIIEMANKVLHDDVNNFKNKIIIEDGENQIKLTNIPPFVNTIKVDKYELKLANILPTNYPNIDYVSSLINQFVDLGLNHEQLSSLFGIGQEPEISEIFQMFSEQVEVLENADQLAFAVLYDKFFDKIDLTNFKVLSLNGQEYNLSYNFYLKKLDFISKDAILDDRYYGIKKILGDLPYHIDEDIQILDQPYFIENKFVCPEIEAVNLTDEQKLSFIEYLFDHWKSKKTNIRKINWQKIDNIDTIRILGFNPVISVYPNDYACESEVLPDFILNWIRHDENRVDFLTDLGVWTENSVVVELRKCLSGEIDEFQSNRLAQEIKFNENETNLFNSFEWLKEKEIMLKTAEQFEIFKKVVAIINDNRGNINVLRIEEEFDFGELTDNSSEWDESYYVNWKEVSNISIYLYEGELPKSVSLDEIENYVFYYCCEDNIAIDDDNNIYINANADIKKKLRKLELDNDTFDFDELWQNKLEVLEKQLLKINDATLETKNSTDISKNDQQEANREAKEIVMEKLEIEGFEFKEGIGEYSTINGVFKENVEFPLVVKSYKYHDEPLKIGANEWIQLMKPNSMFWIHYGNRKLGCLNLYELLRKQDKLSLSFSTENLDFEHRLENFAELLHYFKNVHFDFSSIRPDDYSTAENLNNYRFNERRNETDLSSDSEENLH